MEFRHRNKSFSIELPDDGALELYVDGCLRKSRARGEREPQYVWTNMELEWEEHVYIEARYWSSSGRLDVSVNGKALFTCPPDRVLVRLPGLD
ncbi:MAG: hypothetical protein O7E57_11310 [Gammaproteobacteria bacterium]|nr:hypothetical protein [Gammaproteobacteria bacterium]